MRGLDSNKKEAWKLTNCGDYRYTNQGITFFPSKIMTLYTNKGVAHVPDVDDNKDFLSVA
jgi:hypothetical protein